MDREVIVRTLVSDRAKLLAYVWAIVRDDHVAEDLFQDVIVVAMDPAQEFNDASHVLKWSRVTLRNKGLEYLRNKRSSKTCLAPEILDALEDHWAEQDDVSAAELSNALRLCLTSLTDNARDLVNMRYAKSMRGKDIAEATGKSVHTVYVALSRAYKALGDCISSKVNEETRHV